MRVICLAVKMGQAWPSIVLAKSLLADPLFMTLLYPAGESPVQSFCSPITAR